MISFKAVLWIFYRSVKNAKFRLESKIKLTFNNKKKKKKKQVNKTGQKPRYIAHLTW